MRDVILLNIDDGDFYDDAVVLIKSFYPRTEVVTGSIEPDERLVATIDAVTPSRKDREKRILHEEFKTKLYKDLSENT